MVWDTVKKRSKQLMLYGGLGFATLFGVRNNFEPLQTNKLDEDPTEIIDSPSYGEGGYSISVRPDISIDFSDSLNISAITESGDTISNYMISAYSFEENIVFKTNPYLEKVEVSINNRESEKLIATKKFDISPLFKDFDFDPSKPVMIHLDGMETNAAPSPPELTALAKINHEFYKISRNNVQRELKAHYGDNVLFLREGNLSQWQAISEELKKVVPSDVKIHVAINDHHGISPAGRGIYEGLFVNDRQMVDLLSLLPCESQNLTVIHEACSVDSIAFEGKGNHIFIAPKGNYAVSTPSLLGKMKSVYFDIIPHLAKGESLEEIQQVIDDSYAGTRQNAVNLIDHKIKDMIEPDNDVTPQRPTIISAPPKGSEEIKR